MTKLLQAILPGMTALLVVILTFLAVSVNVNGFYLYVNFRSSRWSSKTIICAHSWSSSRSALSLSRSMVNHSDIEDDEDEYKSLPLSSHPLYLTHDHDKSRRLILDTAAKMACLSSLTLSPTISQAYAETASVATTAAPPSPTATDSIVRHKIHTEARRQLSALDPDRDVDLRCLADLPTIPSDSIRIYLCRHGQTENNRLRKVQGARVDPPINDNGRIQATNLGRALALAGSSSSSSSSSENSLQQQQVHDRSNIAPHLIFSSNLNVLK
jgi:Histidine phosphatase superfamily (branch 1)